MAQLNFCGPFHFDEISNGSLNQLDKPGIYIWGFMYRYDYDKKQGVGPINFKKEEIAFPAEGVQFIPYYVGEMTTKVSARLKKHYNIRQSDASKYIRLSNDYMLNFFNDLNFPTNDSSSSKLKIAVDKIILRNHQEIQYYNNGKSLEMIYGSSKIQPRGDKYHWPITNQVLNNSLMPDTLYDLTCNINNFWFCYATFEPDNVIVTKPMLLPLETYTYWSLKGKTISKTGKFGQIDQTIKIIDHTNAGIFKKVNNIVKPSNIFDGY